MRGLPCQLHGYRTGAMRSHVTSAGSPALDPPGAAQAPQPNRETGIAPGEEQGNGADRAPGAGVPAAWPGRAQLHVGFVGSAALLDVMAPSQPSHGLTYQRLAVDAGGPGVAAGEALGGLRSRVTVVLDPVSMEPEVIASLPGTTLGVLVEGLPDPKGPPDPAEAEKLNALDRLVSFDPALTGETVGEAVLWRAIPPPVSDSIFGEVRRIHGPPRALSLGRSTPYREAMLMPAKHHNDLLQVIHGVTGETLRELLQEYDVGVFAARTPAAGFGHQIGVHLAAGQLLLCGPLAPGHGLERDIDYVGVKSGEQVTWVLERLARFPEMHQRVRVRGRMKAEHFRASRVFARVVHDLLADVAAFGPLRATAP
jgi:hypothetical protein